MNHTQAIDAIEAARRNMKNGHAYTGRTDMAALADVQEFIRKADVASGDKLPGNVKGLAQRIAKSSDDDFTASAKEIQSMMKAIEDKLFVELRASCKSRKLKAPTQSHSLVPNEPDAAFARWCAIGSIWCSLSRKRNPFGYRARDKVAVHYRSGSSAYEVAAIFNDSNDTGFGSEHGKTVNIMGR